MARGGGGGGSSEGEVRRWGEGNMDGHEYAAVMTIRFCAAEGSIFPLSAH